VKAVLVGGGGFIGHHTALEMAKRGWKPTIMDSFGINNLYALEPGPSLDRSMIQERIRLLNAVGVPIVQVDARNYELLSQNISWVKPDVILHFAAVSHIDRSNKSPRTTLDHSLRTLENSLDIARALECRLIYFSSSTVYGDWEEEFVTEETLCKPKGIYGRMKLAGELLVDGYHEVFDLPTVIIRPCALYGPRCISRRVTQIFVENALLRKPITMQGGGQMTDFTCVDDLVEGIMLCCEREFAHPP
jgi:nucleoside-diphosphate-sugar epimerase